MPEKNEVTYSKGFLKDVRRLPRRTQDKLVDLIKILSSDAFHPRLHTKPLARPLHGKYSFRITRDWRAGFKFIAPSVICLLTIDHRDKIYERLKRL